MEFDFVVEHMAGHARVAVEGDLDLATAPAIRSCLLELVNAGYADVVVDAGGLGFMDSSGIAVLVAAHNRLTDQGGGLRIVNTSAKVHKVLEICGLTEMFGVEP